jgi:hypothetical protein
MNNKGKVITKNVLRNRWKARSRRPEILSGLEPTEREITDPTAEARSRIAVDQLLDLLVRKRRILFRNVHTTEPQHFIQHVVFVGRTVR